MARSTETIISEMDDAQATETSLSTLNSTSQTAIYTLWKSITATIINYLEQLWDLYKVDIETQISNGAVGSNAWLQDKTLEFQYDATTPQVLTLVDFAPRYTVVDETKRIITRCAVKTTTSRTCLIKVAKSDPPVALSGAELSSLSGYISDISFAGVNYLISSTASDKIYIKADIYYDGQYASTISANVITAINTYLANIPFDGSVKLMSLTDAIQSVTGVTDVLLRDVAIRANATVFGSKTYLVQSSTSLIPVYPTQAGYVVEETTAGEAFTDKLTFIAE